MPELDDAPYAGRRDLVRASGGLADHPFFQSWGFDSAVTTAAVLGAPPPSGGRWTDRQFRPLVEQLVDPSLRDLLRQRLRRQAWLLEEAGDLQARDLALATAASLDGAGPDELAKQPFLRQMVRRSVSGLMSALLYGE